MNQASSENQPFGKWYLFIGDGICLQVSSDLVLGEDEEGLVVLNPKQTGYGLLKIRKDEDGRLLLKNTSKRHVLDWQKGTATMVGGEFSLVAGSKIVLPNNELYLNHEMQRGQVSAQIIVQASEPVLEQVEVLVEVIPEAVVKPLPDVTQTAPEREPLVAAKLLDQEVFAEPQVQQVSVPETPVAGGNNRIVLVGAAVGLCLVVAMLVGTWFSTPNSDAPGITQNSRAPAAIETPIPALLPTESTPADIDPVEAPIVQNTEIDSTIAALVVSEPAAVEAEVLEPQPLAPVAVATELAEQGAVNDPAVAAGLARARAYMEQGLITQPKDGNAVMELSNILWQDPSHQAAFEMMGEATTRLLNAAVEAHSAGFEYEARNLIEEVLGFNPQHPQANAYKQQWSGN